MDSAITYMLSRLQSFFKSIFFHGRQNQAPFCFGDIAQAQKYFEEIGSVHATLFCKGCVVDSGAFCEKSSEGCFERHSVDIRNFDYNCVVGRACKQ